MSHEYCNLCIVCLYCFSALYTDSCFFPLQLNAGLVKQARALAELFNFNSPDLTVVLVSVASVHMCRCAQVLLLFIFVQCTHLEGIII